VIVCVSPASSLFILTTPPWSMIISAISVNSTLRPLSAALVVWKKLASFESRFALSRSTLTGVKFIVISLSVCE